MAKIQNINATKSQDFMDTLFYSSCSEVLSRTLRGDYRVYITYMYINIHVQCIIYMTVKEHA